MAAAKVLGTFSERSAGSSPVLPTIFSGSKYFEVRRLIYWLIYNDKDVVIID